MKSHRRRGQLITVDGAQHQHALHRRLGSNIAGVKVQAIDRVRAGGLQPRRKALRGAEVGQARHQRSAGRRVGLDCGCSHPRACRRRRNNQWCGCGQRGCGCAGCAGCAQRISTSHQAKADGAQEKRQKQLTHSLNYWRVVTGSLITLCITRLFRLLRKAFHGPCGPAPARRSRAT